MSGILLNVSIALLAGLLMTRVFSKLKLPDVTAYLIAGVLIGPYCIGAFGIQGLGFTTMHEVETLNLISKVALGFIAFSIGNEFRLDDLKKIGKQAFVIGIFQALAATLCVDLALLAMHFIMPDKLTLPQVIVLGAIATATAPAATLMVVRQYKAKGPLTDLLLPIVALDDAVGLIVFAVSLGIAKTLVSGTVDFISIFINPLVEIILSLLLGAVMGWVLTQLEKLFHSNTNRLNMTIAFVFLTVSLSMISFSVGPVHVGFSSLLVCMMLGTVFCNTCDLSEDLMEAADKWTSPLFALFFVISGAELELSVFTDWAIVVIGIVYIVFRCVGKYTGTFISAKATKCAPQICKYLGITLFPQAGVALGMCATAMQLGEQGNLIRNITLFAVLIYEIVGPLMTREALTAAGDIRPKSADVINRRANKLAAVGSDEAAEAAALAAEEAANQAKEWAEIEARKENRESKNK
ncbi:MAG: cation:proton antiporter [Oscillospiraceae bacterium]|nr:cation:proton antiporter [Oscillospiraceae bacterium]